MRPLDLKRSGKMNSIALVFFTMSLNAQMITGPEISETLFESHEACGDFVNIIANDGTNPDVVDENFEFKFASQDGLVFYGGCYDGNEYTEKFLKNE